MHRCFIRGHGGGVDVDGQVIAYGSRKPNEYEFNYPTYDLDLVEIVHALVQWRHFLGHGFELHNDHCILYYIFT